MGRAELKMQAHIIDSYKLFGGYATKWNDEHAKGKPDLVCSMAAIGVHLVEVKHRPDFVDRAECTNQLEPRQYVEAKRFIKAGGTAMAGLLVGGHSSVASARLAYFDPLQDTWDLLNTKWVPWQSKMKFSIPTLLEEWRLRYG